MISKKFLAFVLMLSMVFPMASCSVIPSESIDTDGVTDETVVNTETIAVETEEVITFPPVPPETVKPVPVLPENMNPLTGLECDASLVGQRPIAVMFNNLREALPQIGLSQCDIIYEVLAEGGILRLEGIIQDYAEIEKLGSVRSARPYYAELSTAYDAIYVHAGRSALAANVLSRLQINNLNGVEGPGGAAFYRDQDRLNGGYAMEHTMFTSGENIVNVAKVLGYRTERNDTSFSAFKFDPAFKSIGSGISASYIKVPHSYYSVSEFKYNENDELYYHYQYDDAHVDGANNKHIATENVFILFADHSVNPDGKTLSIRLTGEGKGYYFSCGEAISIVWKRASETGTFSYYLEDGTELSVRQGKSFISIADNKIASAVTIS